ncbi:MAG: 3-dehydroquinate synthase [Deltaproteobacteria bacterium]|nr:3-dehydroquinate synthase [Deltaproteobacteria bacterium]
MSSGAAADRFATQGPMPSCPMPICLWGMMGTGKSTLGKKLAEELQRSFVDVDDALEAELKVPIATFFATRGEAQFRIEEKKMVRKLLDGDAVIALGGGALLDAKLFQEANLKSHLVVLNASTTTLEARLFNDESESSNHETENQNQEQNKRPLLRGKEGRMQLKAKLFERMPLYQQASLQVATDGPIDDVIQRLLQHLSPVLHVEVPTARLSVRTPSSAYDVVVHDGGLLQVGAQCKSRLPNASRAAVVCQPPTRVYAEQVVQLLEAQSIATILVELDDGERFKTWESVEKVHDACGQSQLTRKDFLVAVGGGVVGDLTGFAAATWMRGVAFVQVPTTLLSMVDASVGGKTAINHSRGKNLVGAFHFPSLVLVDPEVLQTLDDRHVKSGIAEMLKHALLDVECKSLIAPQDGAEENALKVPSATQIAESIQVKTATVEEDPFEGGRRATLNLGHTFGHAVEHLMRYKWTHGEAVALGILAATMLSVDLGLADKTLLDDVCAQLTAWNLPTSLAGTQLQATQLVEAMQHDKKKEGAVLKLILLRDVGNAVIQPAPDEKTLANLFVKLGARP